MRYTHRAFTLIELLVILVILATIFYIASPSFFSSIKPQKTRNFVMNLQSTLEYLDDKSILEKKIFLFTFDIDERVYHFTVSEEGNPEGLVKDKYLNPVKFPEGLTVKSIRTIPGGTVFDGEITVPFTPNGMLFSFEIMVEEKPDQWFVIVGDSLSNRIQVLRKSDQEL
jgi:type II secretory pathway pseudopilin PulG